MMAPGRLIDLQHITPRVHEEHASHVVSSLKYPGQIRNADMLNRRQFLLVTAVGTFALPLRAQTQVRLTHRVKITKFTFEPALIEVRAGDVIEWTNLDLVPHTATANDHSWDTGSLENGVTRRIVMKSPGVFAYRCAFHPNMEGVVTVVR